MRKRPKILQEVSGEDGESRYHFEFSLTVSVLYDTIFI